jgi:hypothetical protein
MFSILSKESEKRQTITLMRFVSSIRAYFAVTCSRVSGGSSSSGYNGVSHSARMRTACKESHEVHECELRSKS